MSLLKLPIIIFLLTALTLSCGAQNSKKNNEKQTNIQISRVLNLHIQETLTELPESIRKNILANPDGFLVLAKQMTLEDPSFYILVDKKHSISADYVPEDLIQLAEYPEIVISKKSHSVRKVVLADLFKMNTDAKAVGFDIVVSSSYRSYNYQKTVYERNVKQMGQAAADRESAKPGTSQHQLGTAIDFGSITDDFAYTPEGKWLMNNSWKYGFTLSFPDGYEDITGYRYECWHYRYIGKSASKMQKDYFNNLQHYLITYWNQYSDFYKKTFSGTQD